jgi:ribosomal protein L3 glutamine methyltransferase
MKVNAIIQWVTAQLEQSGVSFGHGTDNAADEANWLVLWSLGKRIDTDSTELTDTLVPENIDKIQGLLQKRIETRLPLAYITHEAWLCGVPFYVDERAIIPRSFIAELLLDETIDAWLSPNTKKILDLCTGNGSLAVLAARTYQNASVLASDISNEALAVAQINIKKHQLDNSILLIESDGIAASDLKKEAPFDLILCNPPYVTKASMDRIPLEYRAEPSISLLGGEDGMDFIRSLFLSVAEVLSPEGILVLEIGHERHNFEMAFPNLNPIWLETSAGDSQVLLLHRSDFVA